jgi:dTDP-glucose 4,6-dehydratase
MPVVIMRSANNYGPCQFPEKLIPLMIRNAIRREQLPVYGDGAQRRDWLYVEDNVEAILQVLEQGGIGTIYNVGAGEERTNLDVVQAICRLLATETGFGLKELLQRITFVADRPGHDRRYALATGKIRQELGWAPGVSFEEGLQRTIRSYLVDQDWIKQVTSGAPQAYYEAVYVHSWREKP